ncbi:hypothetical protein [Marinoscillum furvescens]|uniref:Uncharacterized protein n=1 Tax=Marinoscillum furvescens DSM 4134 TaxID=1122208 RepID=A0A3D9L6R5_MARFU|nr:hypothetical protein [Marinoscillum furvescens]REE02051.1 hypothetical protein C7460_10271 [Marinoscillum furvescens DSM 4134]
MKKPMLNFFNSGRILLSLFVSLCLVLASCQEDDGPDPDAPVIDVAGELAVRGGEHLEVSFTVAVPGGIADLEVTASAGEVTIDNSDDILGATSGEVLVGYEPSSATSGYQTITLTVTDELGNESSLDAEVEVFLPVSFGMALVSGAGDVTTTFLNGVVDINSETVSNSNSTELAQYAALFSDGKAMYTAGFGAPATMGKYEFNSAGEAELTQEIIVPGANSFSSVLIVDEQTGYATVGGGLARAVQFSPADMRITGEIDLSEAGDGLFYSDMIIRDQTLFIALNDFGSSGEAKVAVVDLQTNTLQKVITDDRTATLFGTLPSSIMASDANGDIYIQASGLFSGKPSGILRINAGETAFDPDYFFNLTDQVGGSCFGLYLIGGVAFTALSENDDNWFGFDGDKPSFSYRKLDLTTSTDQGALDAALPNTFAGSRTLFFVQVSDDEVFFPIAGSDEDALYSYSLSTGDVTKKTTSTSGYVTGLVQVY